MRYQVWSTEGNEFPELMGTFSSLTAADDYALDLMGDVDDYLNDDQRLVWVEDPEGTYV